MERLPLERGDTLPARIALATSARPPIPAVDEKVLVPGERSGLHFRAKGMLDGKAQGDELREPRLRSTQVCPGCPAVLRWVVSEPSRAEHTR